MRRWRGRPAAAGESAVNKGETQIQRGASVIQLQGPSAFSACRGLVYLLVRGHDGGESICDACTVGAYVPASAWVLRN
jgi:hypothetical protein